MQLKTDSVYRTNGVRLERFHSHRGNKGCSVWQTEAARLFPYTCPGLISTFLTLRWKRKTTTEGGGRVNHERIQRSLCFQWERRKSLTASLRREQVSGPLQPPEKLALHPAGKTAPLLTGGRGRHCKHTEADILVC